MLKTRLVNAAFFLAIVAGLLVLFVLGSQLHRLTSRPPQLANTPVILQQVQTLSNLITVKYVMEKVVDLPDVKWYGENRVLMIAHGIVLGGINLGEMKEGDIEVSGKKVIMKLPPARAPLDLTFLNDRQTKVIERTTGLLRSFDKDLEQTARQLDVLDVNRAAREAGILKDAEDRAKLQLKAFLLQLGFQEVEFKSP